MTLLEIINTDGIPNTLGELSQIKQAMKSSAQQTFEQWVDRGQPDITDPAEHNYLLEWAITTKNKKAILLIYDRDSVDWEVEDSLADEHDELIDLANDIVYS